MKIRSNSTKIMFLFYVPTNNLFIYLYDIYKHFVIPRNGASVDNSKKTSIFTCSFSNYVKIISSRSMLIGYTNNQLLFY